MTSDSDGPNRTLPETTHWLEFARDAMACRFEILLHPNEAALGSEAAYEALETITYLEQILSVYIPSSDFSRLNANGSQSWLPISESAYQLLKLGKEIHESTQGAFDITAAKLSKIWGFQQRQGKMPTETEIASALVSIGTQHIELDETHKRARLHQSVEINPGGIGKGFALDCAVEALRKKGVQNFAFHGGKSSVLCRGSQSLREPEHGWKIAVRHPEQSERILGTLSLMDQALGTSGPANQFFYFRGKRYGHIIDPRTGWPSDGLLSVTVLHESAGWADALATGLFVMGRDSAIAYCERNPNVSMLALVATQRAGTCEAIACNMKPDQWLQA